MRKDKIKILYVHHGTGIGGAPISLLNLVKALDKEHYEVKVAFIKDSTVVELFREADIQVEILNASNTFFVHNETGPISWRYFYRYPAILFYWLDTAYRFAPRYLRQQNVDIVHLNSHVLSSWAFAAKRLGFKVVCHNRETVAKGYFGIRRGVLRKIYDYAADVIINISQDNAKRMGLPHKSEVVYNFVDIPLAPRTPFSSSLLPYKVLFLGGMAKIKGFPVAVECLKYLGTKAIIQFAGGIGKIENNPKTNLERLKRIVKLTFFRPIYLPLSKINQASNAEVLGMLKQALDAINHCDVLITPFLVEHFSRPAIEAFAYGKPVIGSNVEGMDEIIDHGVNGLLVEKGNAKALAEAINYLCNNPELAQEMGRAGREKAEKLFSPKVNIKAVEKIYDKVLK